MEHNYENLIRDLAEKLGTTAEQLWSVLLAQAQLNSISSLCVYLVWVAVLFVGYKIVNIQASDFCKEMKIVFYGVLSLIFFVYLISSINGVVTGFVNPEYFALNEVLRRL